MLSAGTFQFSPPENSVSDRPQGFVNYGYPGALPPASKSQARQYMVSSVAEFQATESKTKTQK